ncbi:MAG: hypothetical protein ACLTYW_01320 [Collinsella sp.]
MSLKVYRGRTLARSQALQLLFQAEATDSPLERVLEGDFDLEGSLDPYALELCRGAYEHIDRIDCALRPLPRTGIRACPAPIAICSSRRLRDAFLTDEEVSDAIVINEAVELPRLWHRPVCVVRQRRAGQDRSQRGAAGRGPVPRAAGRGPCPRGGPGRRGCRQGCRRSGGGRCT